MRSTDTRKAFGYTLIKPPGWARIPLKEGTEDAVKKIVDEAAEQISEDFPRDKVIDARMELYRQLNTSVREARRRDGVDLYLPVQPLHGVLVAASFVVAKTRTRLRDGIGPRDVLLHLVSDSDSMEPLEVDGAPGARSERVLAANPEKGIETPSKHVDYVAQVPSAQNSFDWIVVSFNAVGDGNPEGELTAILVELFDAVMTTFRWRTE
ncbi:hypothetical protein [Streptomyces sp. NPDC051214]|uniref:hypothetical protein n=1 Tax=Streptomyces sp. NPDC051214 TaxID=3155282 RepID=UPI00341A4EA9